ncbi:hypothetical protein COOONC_06430 [Cooperia oncophora]
MDAAETSPKGKSVENAAPLLRIEAHTRYKRPALYELVPANVPRIAGQHAIAGLRFFLSSHVAPVS